MARSSSDSFWNRTRQAIEIRLRDKNVPLITKKNSIAICLTRTLSLDAVAASCGLSAPCERAARRARTAARSNQAWKARIVQWRGKYGHCGNVGWPAEADDVIGPACREPVSAPRAGARHAMARSELIASRA